MHSHLLEVPLISGALLSLMSCHLFHHLVSSFSPLCLTMDSQIKNAYIPLVKMCSIASRVVSTWNTVRNVDSWAPPQTDYITMCIFNKILAGLISSLKFEKHLSVGHISPRVSEALFIQNTLSHFPSCIVLQPLSFLCS